MPLVIEPHGSHVLLKRLPAETTSPGGIVIPEVSQERPTRGVVIAVGPGRTHPCGRVESVPLQTGDVVAYSQHKGTEITIADCEVTLVHADHVLGVLADA